MVDVLNRATKQYLPSANTPDYPTAEWIHRPDLSAVAGQPTKYWNITGDTVSLMSAAQRQAVDDAERDAGRDATAAQLDLVDDVLRAFALAMLDEINLLRGKAIPPLPPRTIGQLKTAVRSKLGT